MVSDMQFECSVRGYNISQALVTQKYTLRAKDKAIAESIVFDLFSRDFGLCSDTRYNIVPVIVSDEDNRHLLDIFSSIYSLLAKSIEGKSYKEFITLYEQFDGCNFESIAEVTSFEISFRGLCLRVIYDGKVSRIDTRELTYTSSKGVVFIIKNDWKQFYYG